jgi:hypothetical protein
MTNVVNLLIKLLGIVIFFVVIIAVIYAWILPTFWHGHKTYSFLFIGIIGSAVLGGYCCYKTVNALMSLVARYFLSSFAGLIVAVIVVVFSLFIILNVRGA